MTLRTAFRAAALALAAGALVAAGCGGDSTPSGTGAPAKIVVALDWTPNTNHEGVYLAAARGLYKREGLDVSIVEPDQSGAVAQVAAGNAQFGFGAESIIQSRLQGTKVRSIATVLQTNTSSLISPAGRGIRRPRDLAGKTYGTYGGEMERPLIEALVRCDGGDPSTVKFVEVGNVDYSVGFRKRQYDAVWVFDGWDTIRMRDLQKLDVTTLPFRDYLRCIPDWYTPILFASDDYLEAQPEVVRRFLAATAEGYRIAAADPEAAARAVKKAAPESDMALLVPSARFLSTYLLDGDGHWGTQDAAVWDRFNAFLGEAKLPALDTASEIFTNDYLPAAK